MDRLTQVYEWHVELRDQIQRHYDEAVERASVAMATDMEERQRKVTQWLGLLNYQKKAVAETLQEIRRRSRWLTPASPAGGRNPQPATAN